MVILNSWDPLNFHVSLLKRLGLFLFLHLLGRKELWHLFCYSLQQILRVGSSQLRNQIAWSCVQFEPSWTKLKMNCKTLMNPWTKCSVLYMYIGEQGWRSGESARLPCVPGSIPGPGVICGLSLFLVLYSAPRGFSPGSPVFPSPQNPTFPNSNSISECTWMHGHVWTSSSVSSLVLRG